MTSAAGTRATTTQGAFDDRGRGHHRPPPRVLRPAGVAFAAAPGHALAFRDHAPDARAGARGGRAARLGGGDDAPGAVHQLRRPVGTLAEVPEHDVQVVLAGVDDPAGQAGDPPLPVPHRDELVDVLPRASRRRRRSPPAARSRWPCAPPGGPGCGAMEREPRSGSSATTFPVASRKKAPPGNCRPTRGSRSAARSATGSRSSRFTWEAVAGPLQDLEPPVELLLDLAGHGPRRPLPGLDEPLDRGATPGRRRPRPAWPPGSPR